MITLGTKVLTSTSYGTCKKISHCMRSCLLSLLGLALSLLHWTHYLLNMTTFHGIPCHMCSQQSGRSAKSFSLCQNSVVAEEVAFYFTDGGTSWRCLSTLQLLLSAPSDLAAILGYATPNTGSILWLVHTVHSQNSRGAHWLKKDGDPAFWICQHPHSLMTSRMATYALSKGEQSFA